MSTPETDSGRAIYRQAAERLVGRAPRISQPDVFRAADELLIEGHRPTIDRVRMKLGRGSPNTINDHLDAWWGKLGSRLRDLPGQEFPQLPERIGKVLQLLWTEAVNGAHEVLQGSLHEREQALAHREEVLANRGRDLAEQEQATAARTAALEEGLALAREQLAAANQRAHALERSVQERDAESTRLRSRIESLQADCADGRAKLDAASVTHQTERGQLQERYAAAERHWLLEVDRTRQQAKESAREHEEQTKELRRRVEVVISERDQLRQNLLETRAELKTAAAVREQMEERLQAAERAASERAAVALVKSIDGRRSKRRSLKSRRRTRGRSDPGSAE